MGPQAVGANRDTKVVADMYLNEATKDKIDFFKRTLLKWARANLRDFPWRRTSDPYRVLITEKLLQQTDFGHVRKVWGEFFQRFPTIEELAKVAEDEIATVLKPLGLWRQRAKQLKKLAEEILAKHGGIIPCDYASLVELPGVGDYIARATLIFACNKPTYILDVNTRKIVSRFFYYPKQGVKDKAIIAILELLTPKDPEECKLFSWGMIDFSALICSRRPRCSICPLKERCSYYLHTSTS